MTNSENQGNLSSKPLEILYEDEFLVAINKPNGLLVHQSKIARDASEFALQLLRDQLGYFIHPVHRLDRKTSGVLIFAKDKSILPKMQEAMSATSSEKIYLALVRGFFPESLTVDYALTNENNKTQEALTHFKLRTYFEIPLSFQGFETSRYSLIEARPQNGRYHQIRKHCKHVFHPIIGDRPHGCNKQNKLFLERFESTKMYLHANQISLTHPITERLLTINAKLPTFFTEMIKKLSNQNLSMNPDYS
jgi:tRNA pseudouridine65 synthase